MINATYILICLVIYFNRIVHNQLIIKPTEPIISRDQYKSFIALCTGDERIRIVSWQSPSLVDVKEDSNGRVTIERKTYGVRLRIRNLTLNDQGSWKCLGLNRDGQSFSSILQINIKVPITFVSESIQYAELHSTVLIKCRVIANPSAEISWFKGEEKFNILSSNYEQRDDGLKIKRVSSLDNDTFWCQADVIETGESKEYPIQVILARPITSTRITCATPCAVEKRTATLICEANGMPPPQYSWFYGQESPFIVNGISKFIIRENRLIINYVDETDNGRYSCHAFNDYDQKGQKLEYLLNVIVPLSLAPIPHMEMTVDEHYSLQRVTFSCRVQRGSLANLSLEWLYANNTPVQSINGISIDATQLMNYRLIELNFNPVRREHHGNYTCLGKNAGDDSTSTIAHLFVRYKPVLINPKITDIYSVPNHQVILTCQFDSYPPPILQWMRISQEHDSNPMILDENNLQVMNISTQQIDSTIYQTQLTYKPFEEDFGLQFQCRADNSRSERHLITLRRADPPRTVRITEVKPKSHTIELTVQPPVESGGLPLTQYIIQYKQIDISNSTETVSHPVLSNELQIIELKSLQVASLYRIQIAVESPAGRSSFSTPVQAKTFDGDVPQFNLTNISCLINRSYLIEWFVEYDGGSPVSDVEISYAKVRNLHQIDTWSKPIITKSQTNEYELKGLHSKSIYFISIRLFNKAGVSERRIGKTTECHIGSKQSPSIWISVAIIAFIILGTMIVCLVFILNRILCECVVH